MPIEPEILEKARYWANSPVFSKETRETVSQLLDQNDEVALRERFGQDLAFGTAGLRGILGPGSSRMNVYNVRRATHALALHLRAGAEGTPLRVAVSYDMRRFSKEFSEAVAEVFAAHGIHTLLTDSLGPVPLLSYLVRLKSCAAGVYITASHNPPEYNGYKVYLSTGGQIVPPHDLKIIRHFQETKYEDIPGIGFEEAVSKGWVTRVSLGELRDSYLEELKAYQELVAAPDALRIVYTPLHGTGLKLVPHALKAMGFSEPALVEAQCTYDPTFPTVVSPNPGEFKSLALAVEKAKETGADLVLATDPDADRVGAMARVGDRFEPLEGNAMGALLIDFILSRLRSSSKLPRSPLVINTIVTTEMQARIASKYGAAIEETLTGFKWIADRIEAYESGLKTPHKEYVCGGEEAYGFLLGHFIRDKDGVSACCLVASLAAFYKAKGMTVVDALEALYLEHGFYGEYLHTNVMAGSEGVRKIAKIIGSLREKRIEKLAGLTVTRTRDFLKGTDSAKEESLASFPKSNVLQFYLNEDIRLSVRPSGTEPLIKYYLSVRVPVSEKKEIPIARKEANLKAASIFSWLETYVKAVE